MKTPVVVTLLMGVLWAADASATPISLLVDSDDDDRDGRADTSVGAQLEGEPPSALQSDWPMAPSKLTAGETKTPLFRALRYGARPDKGVRLQGLAVGRGEVGGREVLVFELALLDAKGAPIAAAGSHAALSRQLPKVLGGASDPEVLRWVVRGPKGALPSELKVRSLGLGGSLLDEVEALKLTPGKCPASSKPGVDTECATTPAFRLVPTFTDKNHPLVKDRALQAEVGGAITATFAGLASAAHDVPVGGPRSSKLGSLERYRGKLRVRIVRISEAGDPPVGGDVDGALDVLKSQVSVTSAVWGQCGIHFGSEDDLDMAVVDPPQEALVSIGCGSGLPASGGWVSLRVGVGPQGRRAPQKLVSLETRPGQTPLGVARALQSKLQEQGLEVELSPNAAISPGARRSADLILKDKRGRLVTLAPPKAATEVGAKLSTDPTLGVCLGEVDLSDGVDHFTDFDAAAGTLEERALIKPLLDDDPTTIDIVVVPNFAVTGRIGESFIYADGSSIRNVIVLDRGGIRAGSRSFTLAHELGHILLDMPGHPDDFGVDQPTQLMDADASDASIFGPRRLSLSDCERAIRQAGPQARVPLLEKWPLREAKVLAGPERTPK